MCGANGRRGGSGNLDLYLKKKTLIKKEKEKKRNSYREKEGSSIRMQCYLKKKHLNNFNLKLFNTTGKCENPNQNFKR